MDGNLGYTTKLFDVVVPERALDRMMKLKQLYFVMEYIPFDLTTLLTTGHED